MMRLPKKLVPFFDTRQKKNRPFDCSLQVLIIHTPKTRKQLNPLMMIKKFQAETGIDADDNFIYFPKEKEGACVGGGASNDGQKIGPFLVFVFCRSTKDICIIIPICLLSLS